MPNAFFRAKEIWDGGDPQGGFALLEEYLEQELGDVALTPEERIFFPGAFDRFELAVFAMLDSVDMVQAPFGGVFASIWRMHPHDVWIGLLLNHTFEDPLGFEEFKDLDLPAPDFAFDALVEALADSARLGLLAPDHEGPNSGRPILRLEAIEAVEDEQWGDLKAMLLEALRGAYAECPPDFWERLATDDAEGVVTRFLHDLLLEFRHPLDVVDARWKAIGEHQPRYADAVQSALSRLLSADMTKEYLTELVRIDAGFLVDDGRTWLERLQSALKTSDLRGLLGRRWPERLPA